MKKKKLRILILNWRDPGHPNAGGAELVTMEHAKGWVKRGHQVTWLTSMYDGAKIDEYAEGVLMKRRSGWLMIYPWGFFYTMFSSKLYDIIIDEIHAIPFFTPLATSSKKIVFIHEVAGVIWDYMVPFPINKIGKLFERLYFPLYEYTQFWTDAPSTVNELEQMGIDKSNITDIPCPISPSISIKNYKKESYPSFIFVSRVVAMKGIENVIHAFRYILQELPSAQLTIVGGGRKEYIERLRGLINKLQLEKHVVFVGKVTESKKLELMGTSHILMHASIKEGWGLVVLEAASQGTPSIVYNVGGLKDVVKHNKTGIVLSENTHKQLAREVIDLYKDHNRYKKFQKAGQEWVTSLQWEQVINKSEQLLLKVATSTV